MRFGFLASTPRQWWILRVTEGVREQRKAAEAGAVAWGCQHRVVMLWGCWCEGSIAHDFVLVFGGMRAVFGRQASSLHLSWTRAPTRCSSLRRRSVKQQRSAASFGGTIGAEKLAMG